MIRPKFFIEALREKGIDCFAGVPDSLLKNICAYIFTTIYEFFVRNTTILLKSYSNNSF